VHHNAAVTTSATDALITERLILRRPKDSDLEPFALLCADPEVMRYIGSGRALDRGSAERSFAIIQAHWGAHGSGLRSAISREDGEYLGFVGLAVVPARSVAGGETEIGWRLRRAAWGKGLATEGALVVRDNAFQELGVRTLVSLIQPDNHASRRVAEKIGMRPDAQGRGAHGERVVVHRISAEDVA
jgi:RimJ/RimL family protein N-acetyltransferase